jgi:vacuolar-type H+-ATPase subunit H
VNGEEAKFSASARPRPELVQQAAPPIPADRELPRAPRQEELKGAVQEKVEQAKHAVTRAKESTSEAIQDAKQQAAKAVAEAGDRAADLYEESRVRARKALSHARSRLNKVLDEYPLQVIAGVAAAAFVAGILLRVWRSNRDA